MLEVTNQQHLRDNQRPAKHGKPHRNTNAPEFLTVQSIRRCQPSLVIVKVVAVLPEENIQVTTEAL